jgi:hypothetical protein
MVVEDMLCFGIKYFKSIRECTLPMGDSSGGGHIISIRRFGGIEPEYDDAVFLNLYPRMAVILKEYSLIFVNHPMG